MFSFLWIGWLVELSTVVVFVFLWVRDKKHLQDFRYMTRSLVKRIEREPWIEKSDRSFPVVTIEIDHNEYRHLKDLAKP